MYIYTYTSTCSSLPPSTSPITGGNAGLAAAYAARQLGLPIKVIVPETTSAVVVEKLKKEGAEVEVIGKVRLCLAHHE